MIESGLERLARFVKDWNETDGMVKFIPSSEGRWTTVPLVHHISLEDDIVTSYFDKGKLEPMCVDDFLVYIGFE